MEKKEFEDLEIRDEVLDLARNEMKKNILKRKKIAARRKIILRTSFIIVLLAVLILPIALRSLQRESEPTNNTWFSSPSYQNIDLNALEKETISSIESVNQEHKQSFYWLKQGTRLETIRYTYEKDIVMLEETYTYEDVSVTLYVMHRYTIVGNFEMTTVYYMFDSKRNLYLASDNENCYARLDDGFKYYIKINSTNQETMLQIIDSLRN